MSLDNDLFLLAVAQATIDASCRTSEQLGVQLNTIVIIVIIIIIFLVSIFFREVTIEQLDDLVLALLQFLLPHDRLLGFFTQVVRVGGQMLVRVKCTW